MASVMVKYPIRDTEAVQEGMVTDKELEGAFDGPQFKNCLIGRDPNEYTKSYNSCCRPGYCHKCGFFPKEHKRRMALFYCNGLSRKGSLLYLNIKEE